jgi:hypothetical protein
MSPSHFLLIIFRILFFYFKNNCISLSEATALWVFSFSLLPVATYTMKQPITHFRVNLYCIADIHLRFLFPVSTE